MNLHTVISLRISPELKQRIDVIKKRLGLSQPQIMEKGVEYYEEINGDETSDDVEIHPPYVTPPPPDIKTEVCPICLCKYQDVKKHLKERHGK